jgi:hypothetical protein
MQNKVWRERNRWKGMKMEEWNNVELKAIMDTTET